MSPKTIPRTPHLDLMSPEVPLKEYRIEELKSQTSSRLPIYRERNLLAKAAGADKQIMSASSSQHSLPHMASSKIGEMIG